MGVPCLRVAVEVGPDHCIKSITPDYDEGLPMRVTRVVWLYALVVFLVRRLA